MRCTISMIAALALCGCASQAIEEAPAPLQPTVETGAVAEGQEHEKIAAQLALLDTSVVTGSATERFLASGMLELGAQDAPHTLTVFTEYHCNYCTQFHSATQELLGEFLQAEDLKIRFVFLPLKKYPNSESAIRGLLCSGKMGQGLQMHTLLTERQNRHRSSVIAYADELGIDADAFAACLDSEETSTLIGKHRGLAQNLEVSLIPTFFLGGERITGLPVDAELQGWVREKVRRQK